MSHSTTNYPLVTHRILKMPIVRFSLPRVRDDIIILYRWQQGRMGSLTQYDFMKD